MNNTHAVRFYTNGFLVLADMPGFEDQGYEGVYGNEWPLRDLDVKLDRESLGIILAPDALEVATNWKASRAYMTQCHSVGLAARLLMVETPFDYPTIPVIPKATWRRIGYDVAVVTGDFYSALQQEVLTDDPTSLEVWRSQLNNHGLFDELEVAIRFISARSHLVGSDPALETWGDMMPVRVSRLMV